MTCADSIFAVSTTLYTLLSRMRSKHFTFMYSAMSG